MPHISPQPHVPAPALAPVLAVDDTASNLLALRALTEPLDVELFTAASGIEALDQYAQREYALILLDVMMPGLDGLETLARIRALPRERITPVIFVTAVDLSRSMMNRAYALGAVDYLTKPLDAGAVQAKVHTFVAMYRQEQEIHRQARALRAKDEHIAVLAHDLRTPLNVIATGAAKLQEHSDAAVRTIALRTRRAATRMERLTADVLAFAQAGEGKLLPMKVEADLSTLCADLVSDFQATHPKIEFEAQIEAGATGCFDPQRLQQALANLLGNAVKFGNGWVSLELTTSQSALTVTVTNRGEPIPPDRLPALFQRFERASHAQPGTGLGLYIVRSIAQAHGGDVTVHSDQDHTAFTLHVPR